MAELDELEQRKKELELRRDIRRLERSERLSEHAPKWSWLWIAPLGLVGAVIILGGLIDGPIGITAVGLALLVPVWLKVRGKR